MANERETVADICARMRYDSIHKHQTDDELLCLYADRIEAAYKREVADALDTGAFVEAARKRKVAEEVVKATKEAMHTVNEYWLLKVKGLCDAIERIVKQVRDATINHSWSKEDAKAICNTAEAAIAALGEKGGNDGK